MDNVQKALAAQRKRRADIQSAYDAKKSSAIQKRKTSLQPKQTTKLGAGVGSGVMKYAGENYQQTGIKKAIRETSNYTRTDLLAKARAEESRSAVKAAPKAPSIAQKRASFAAANAPVVEKVSRPKLSPSKGPIGVAGISKAAPKAPSIAPSRTYTDKEKQISSLLATGKKKDGTMKASAQRKIQRIRKK
jgi:hypothetical protein